MFQDHYLKLESEKEFTNPVNSQVFAVLPDDKLFTLEDVIAKCKQCKDAPQNPRVIENTIKNLEETQRIKRIIGVHIWRYCRKF